LADQDSKNHNQLVEQLVELAGQLTGCCQLSGWLVDVSQPVGL